MNELNDIYYVYVLLDIRKPGIYEYVGYSFDYEPFYIGKGKGERKHFHFFKSRLDNNNLKNNVINKIIKETSEKPIVKVIESDLSELESFNLEKDLIKLIGRRDLKIGTLCNLTDGGEGQSGSLEQIGEKNGFYGKKHKKESFYKIYKGVKQLTLDGDLIQTFQSLTEASKSTNSNASKISCVAKGIRLTHNGFKWEFTNSENKALGKSYDKVDFEYIEQIDVLTGEILNTFKTISEARLHLNMSNRKGGIVSCLKGRRNTYGGFKWRYKLKTLS